MQRLFSVHPCGEVIPSDCATQDTALQSPVWALEVSLLSFLVVVIFIFASAERQDFGIPALLGVGEYFVSFSSLLELGFLLKLSQAGQPLLLLSSICTIFVRGVGTRL